MLKRIEALYNQADYDQADIWCRLALHNVFSGSGTSNVGKLQRLLLFKAVEMHLFDESTENGYCARSAGQTSANVVKFATRCLTRLSGIRLLDICYTK